MPASLFAEMERTGGSTNNGRPGSLQDQRAYELALELSMFGLSNENESVSLNGGNFIENGAEPRGGVGKKSQNTTECVPVPSSEHVAEIVGRQGCKIKALRAKTNTYIKTPVRGEEPVFVVTGRKEDVSAAKREILSAADHFSQIRAQRKNNLNGTLMPGPNSNIPGQTTIQVRVPYRVVGLVVGPKGATIKRIQQQTNTYIVTPSRDKEPIFEVTGLPDSVESARKEIEAHIAMRTGSLIDSCEDNEFGPGILDSAFANNLNAVNSALFKTDLNNDFMTPFSRESNNVLDLATDDIFSFSTSGINGSTKHNDPFSAVFGGSFSNGFNIYEVDEGLGDSPTFDVPAPSLTTSWPDFSSASLTESLFGSTSVGSSSSSSRSGLADLNQRSNSISGALADFVLREHPPARRIQSDPEVSVVDVDGVASCVVTLPSFSPLINTTPGGLINFPVTSSSAISCGSDSSSPIESLAPGNKIKRDCIVCLNGQVVAALVPCGHNCFCYDCARTICEKQEPECPICREPASQAIRIFS